MTLNVFCTAKCVHFRTRRKSTEHTKRQRNNFWKQEEVKSVYLWRISDNYRHTIFTFLFEATTVLNNQFERPHLRSTGSTRVHPPSASTQQQKFWGKFFFPRYHYNIFYRQSHYLRKREEKTCNCVSHYQLIVSSPKILLNQINEANRSEISMVKENKELLFLIVRYLEGTKKERK